MAEPGQLTQRKSNSRTAALRRIRAKKSKHQNITYSKLQGGRFDPGPNPPSFDGQKWMEQIIFDTFRFNSNNPGGYKIGDIAKLIRKQLDPTAHGMNHDESSYRVQYQLKSIRAWNLTGRVIALSIEDYADTAKDKLAVDQICGLMDTGTSTHTPAIGFRLPLALQTSTLRNDAEHGEFHLCDVTGGVGDTLVVYFQLRWRFDGPFKAINAFTPVGELLRMTKRDMNVGFTTSTTKIVEAVESLHASLPETVVNQLHNAAYVVPLLKKDDEARLDRMEMVMNRLLEKMELSERIPSETWSVPDCDDAFNNEASTSQATQ